MIFKHLKDIYCAFVIIDKRDGNIVGCYGNEDFKDFNKIKNISDIDSIFKNLYKKESLPIFDQLKIENRSYWFIRKQKKNHIYYLIQECKYWDATLDNANRKSTIDGLTNLYNKSEIEKQLSRRIFSYLRYKKGFFSILMFDVDFFKKVNDTYGHIAGDFVLKELSLLAQKTLRNSDIIGRFGGEEFIAILPETKVAGAIKLAERLREDCQKHDFIFGKQKIDITISIGVTSVSSTDSPASIMDRCDTALYDAKKKGRNRVEYR